MNLNSLDNRQNIALVRTARIITIFTGIIIVYEIYEILNQPLFKFPDQENSENNLGEVHQSVNWNVTLTQIQATPDNWIIIGFTDLAYVSVAQVWYKQLTNLGYKEHHIVTLDVDLFDAINENISEPYRVINADDSSLQIGGLTEHVSRKKLNRVWAYRWKFIRLMLLRGYNVLMSDTDAIWLKYTALDDLPQFDVFNSISGHLPRNTYIKWGFSLCGCLQAYRSTPKAIALIDKLIASCHVGTHATECDDQNTMNNFYLNHLQLHWKVVENEFGLIGDYYLAEHNSSSPEAKGLEGIKIITFGQSFVSRWNMWQRFRMQPDICESAHRDTLWQINPHSIGHNTGIGAHTPMSKLELFKNFEKCFLPKTLQDCPEIFMLIENQLNPLGKKKVMNRTRIPYNICNVEQNRPLFIQYVNRYKLEFIDRIGLRGLLEASG